MRTRQTGRAMPCEAGGEDETGARSGWMGSLRDRIRRLWERPTKHHTRDHVHGCLISSRSSKAKARDEAEQVVASRCGSWRKRKRRARVARLLRAEFGVVPRLHRVVVGGRRVFAITLRRS